MVVFIKMPLNKRNKNKVVQRAIKRRLIEISFRVDGYIYKNKPITVEEAQKYIHEISLLQTKCHRDKHMLQVIEKLTRCMKTIIEDTTKKVSSHQNVASLENYRSVDLYLESTSLTNKHEEKNVTIDNRYQMTTEALKESNENKQKSNIEDTIVISDDNNDENTDKNDLQSTIYTEDINEVTKESSANFNDGEKRYEYDSCSFNTLYREAEIIASNCINDKSTQLVQTTCDKNIKHLKPNVPKENVNVISDLISKINRNKDIIHESSQNTKKQTSLQSIPDADNRNSNKKNTSGCTQQLPYCLTLNSDTGINANAPKSKIVSKKNKNLESLRNGNKESTNTQKRKKSSNKKNRTETSNFKKHDMLSSSNTAPVFYPPNKYQHTHIDIISNEMSLPMQSVGNSEVQNIVPNQDVVTRQMGTLTIYNKHVQNDLSWIENIRYVREIGVDEFDQISNRFNDTFWDNCLLPNSWKDDDFLN